MKTKKPWSWAGFVFRVASPSGTEHEGFCPKEPWRTRRRAAGAAAAAPCVASSDAAADAGAAGAKQSHRQGKGFLRDSVPLVRLKSFHGPCCTVNSLSLAVADQSCTQRYHPERDRPVRHPVCQFADAWKKFCR